MDPLSIPVLAGTQTGSGVNPDPVRVSKLTTEAEREIAEAEHLIEELRLRLTERAAEEAHAAMEGINGSVGGIASEAVRRGNLAAKTAKKIVEKIDRMAEDELNAARRVVKGIGGSLPVLLEDALAINSAGEYEAVAAETILSPIIEKRLADEKALACESVDGVGIPGSECPVEPLPTPVTDYCLYGDPPVKVLPGQPWTDPNGVLHVCTSVDFPPVTEPVPSVPPITEPVPPVVPPPPAEEPPDARCCPPQTINVTVQMPTPASPPTTSPPPPSEPEEPEPEEPEEPEPEEPTKPKPPKPELLPPLPATTPTGSYDGPQFCANLASVVSKIDNMDGMDGKQWIINAGFSTANSLGGLPIVGEILKGLGQVGTAVVAAAYDSAVTVASAVGITNPGSAAWDVALSALPGLVDKWTGTDISYYMEPVKQVAHTLNPVYLLSQNEADQAYLNGVIDEAQWRCYTLAEGNLPWHHFNAMTGNRRRPGTSEIVALRMRGAISESEFYQRMRNEGVLTKSDAFDYLQLGTQLPTITDLMTWMRKDVANEAYVTLAGLDEDFDKSWTKELNDLALAVGTTPQQIKYEYRAQWQDIPLTQIYQMYWRLRPGRVPNNLAFTRQNALDLMKIQEVPPNFRERILQVAYLPINRTDLLAAHKAGTMTDEDVRQGFMDLGYSPEDATKLRDMTVVKSRREATAALGAWTQRKIIKEYVAGNLTSQQADDLLSRTITDAKVRQQAIADADTIREAQGKAKCIASVKKRFLLGEFDEADAKTILGRLGVEPLVQIAMVNQWYCERTSRRKEPTVTMLIEWTSLGIISEAELLRRLKNLGYSDDDAFRIGTAAKIKDGEMKGKKAEAATEKRDKKRRQAHADQHHNADKHGGVPPGPL